MHVVRPPASAGNAIILAASLLTLPAPLPPTTGSFLRRQAGGRVGPVPLVEERSSGAAAGQGGRASPFARAPVAASPRKPPAACFIRARPATAPALAACQLPARQFARPDPSAPLRTQIGHAGEGGLYAEMVQDRSFDALAAATGIHHSSECLHPFMSELSCCFINLRWHAIFLLQAVI